MTITLLANEQETASYSLSADDDWRMTVDGLYKYEGGKEIAYTIEEEAVEGYEASVDGFTVTNTHTPAPEPEPEPEPTPGPTPGPAPVPGPDPVPVPTPVPAPGPAPAVTPDPVPVAAAETPAAPAAEPAGEVLGAVREAVLEVLPEPEAVTEMPGSAAVGTVLGATRRMAATGDDSVFLVWLLLMLFSLGTLSGYRVRIMFGLRRKMTRK